jgi:hypothetical protein
VLLLPPLLADQHLFSNHNGGGGNSRNLNHQRRHQRCHYPHRPTHPYLQVPYFRPQAGSITTTSRSNSNILSCRFNYKSFSTIVVDSTAFADADPENNVIGNKIESALLKLAKELGWADYKTREKAKVVQMISFSHDHSRS